MGGNPPAGSVWEALAGCPTDVESKSIPKCVAGFGALKRGQPLRPVCSVKEGVLYGAARVRVCKHTKLVPSCYMLVRKHFQ